ncbi:hypothetical protein [Actinomycetospora chiangmaiensis]|nr:hypothetical protein [Actinomycetospora chiangmaiensis]
MRTTAAVVPATNAPFPFDKLVRHYDFADIEQAFADSAAGRTIKPVLRF